MFLGFGPMLAVAGLSFIAALILMLNMDVKLTLVTMLMLPPLYIVGARMRKRLFPISWVMLARTADIATIVEEDVTGIRVVKSFAAEDAQISLFMLSSMNGAATLRSIPPQPAFHHHPVRR